MYIQIIIMAVCLLMSAYFSATETAFSTLSKTKLKTLIEKGNKRASLALKLSENYDRLISTILIGNNLVNILLSAIATVFVIDLLVNTTYENLATTISTAVVTVVVLIFGEITPKSVAKIRPEGFAMFSAPLMQFFIWILIPFSALFSLWTKLIAKIFRVKADNKMSQEELLMLVEEVQEEGSIDDEEGDLLRNAINFTEQYKFYGLCGVRYLFVYCLPMWWGILSFRQMNSVKRSLRKGWVVYMCICILF